MYEVTNLKNLKNIDNDLIKTVLVKSSTITGIYVYDKSKSTIDNSLTIINGWVLQGVLELDTVDEILTVVEQDPQRLIIVKDKIQDGASIYNGMVLQNNLDFSNLMYNLSRLENKKIKIKKEGSLNNNYISDGDTYYIDSIAGDDANNGTSASTPWKNLSKVKNTTFNPGDIILLKKGSIWYDKLQLNDQHGDANKFIEINSYGVGDDPVIYSKISPSLSFTEETTNIWYTEDVSNVIPRLLKNGKEILGTTDKSELGTSIPDDVLWFYDTSASRLYVYSEDDITNTDIFTFSGHDCVLFMYNSSYISINNLNFIGGYFSNARITSCNNINLFDSTHGEFASSAVTITNSDDIFINSLKCEAKYYLNYENSPKYKLASDRGTDNAIEILEECNNITIENTLIKDFGHGSFLIDGKNGNPQNNIKISRCYCANTNLTYGDGRLNIYGNINDVLIEKSIFLNIATGHQFGADNVTFINNIINGIKSSPIKSPSNIGFGISLSGSNCIIKHNIIANTDSEAFKILGKTAKNNDISFNTCFNNGRTMNGIVLGIQPTDGFWNEEISSEFNNNKFMDNLIFSNSINQFKHYNAKDSDGNNLDAEIPYYDFLEKYPYMNTKKSDIFKMHKIGIMDNDLF